jgi:hypothetical protein
MQVNPLCFYKCLFYSCHTMLLHICVVMFSLIMNKQHWQIPYIHLFSLFWFSDYYLPLSSLNLSFTALTSPIYLEGTLTSAAKMEQFAWTFWKISGAQPLLWRQHYFPFKLCFLRLHPMILRMLLLHNRSELAVSYCGSVFSAQYIYFAI